MGTHAVAGMFLFAVSPAAHRSEDSLRVFSVPAPTPPPANMQVIMSGGVGGPGPDQILIALGAASAMVGLTLRRRAVAGRMNGLQEA